MKEVITYSTKDHIKTCIFLAAANQNDEKSEYSEDDKMIPEEISLDKEDYEEKLSQERGYNEEVQSIHVNEQHMLC